MDSSHNQSKGSSATTLPEIHAILFSYVLLCYISYYSCRGLGIACFEQKDYEGARKALKQALKEGTEKTGTIYNLLGACELELGNYEEALSCYEKGLEAEGNSKALKQEMEYNAIVACEGMEDWEQAKERLAKYTDIYPKDEEAKKEAEFLETR